MIWSFGDTVSGQLIQFIIGLILARILSPAEFGLVGMIIVFLAIAQSIVDSGFAQALIRKGDAGSRDYSTVFWFNLAAGLLLFVLLYFISPVISRFYDEPQLLALTRALSIILIINSFSLVQRAILARRLDFRRQALITVISAVISGALAIWMALNGYGVWALVWKSLTGSFIQALLLWWLSSWHPVILFSWESFRELFSFGSRLLVSGLIDTVYRNIYPLIIGKFFTAQDLGYFSRADQFTRLSSHNISQVVQRVSYPALSQVQDDQVRLKSGYRKVIITTMFITFPALLVMAAVAKPLIVVLIGEKWLPAVPYLQLLCLAGMLYPLHAINLNMLKVKGRSDLFLRLEIIKKLLAIPVVIAGIVGGIRVMIAGMIIHSVVCYFINSFYSGRMVCYPFKEQLADIFPAFLIALVVSGLVWLLSFLLPFGNIYLLTVQLSAAIILIIFAAEITGNKGYIEIKSIITEKVKIFKRFIK